MIRRTRRFSRPSKLGEFHLSFVMALDLSPSSNFPVERPFPSSTSNSANPSNCASPSARVNRINRLPSNPPSHSLAPEIDLDRPRRKWSLTRLQRQRLCLVDSPTSLLRRQRCHRLGISRCKWMRASRRRMCKSGWRMVQSAYTCFSVYASRLTDSRAESTGW
jgi:hypothetical protein